MKISKVQAPVLNEKQLEIHRSEPKQVINEKQLEEYRATESNTLIQKMLEDSRTGEATQTTERQLDTQKSKFNNKYRNKEAHTGNMNKLEEKRLKNKPVEKEEYKASSSTPAKLRWWENVKSPDGLKLANNKKVVAQKSQELDFEQPNWGNLQESPEDIIEQDSLALSNDTEDFDVMDQNVSPEIQIKKEKLLPNPEKPYLSGLYMVLGFNPEDFGGNEEKIKQAAIEKVISEKPELAGLISDDDFFGMQQGVDEGTIKLRLVGEFLVPIIEKQNNPESIAEPIAEPIAPVTEITQEPELAEPMTDLGVSEPELAPEQNIEVEDDYDIIDNTDNTDNTSDVDVINSIPMEETQYDETNIDGTPMAIGEIKIDLEVTNNRKQISQEAIKLINQNHPELQIEESSLDMSDLDQGIVRYMVGVPDESITASIDDFDIIVKEASKKN